MLKRLFFISLFAGLLIGIKVTSYAQQCNNSRNLLLQHIESLLICSSQRLRGIEL
jgi:hypothetical protein